MDVAMTSPTSYLPPSGRSLPDELERQAQVWVENPVLHEVLEAMEGFVLLINRQHQILMANVPFLKAAHVEEMLDLRGLRLGEVLGCIHVAEGRDGCGTSPACAQCGVAQAVSCVKQQAVKVTYEALLSCHKGHRWEALEFRIHASPFPGAGTEQILMVCQDISAEKRREVLESVFFHDVLNTLGGLRGWVHALNEGLGDPERAKSKLDTLSAQVIEEVRSQRLVTQAERGELALQVSKQCVFKVLQDCAALASEHPSARGKEVRVAGVDHAWTVATDAELLRRVLLNMTLNALEASNPGEVVDLGAERTEAGLQFTVHNPGVIPPEVQNRIFQRSFSTKAARGRGLGTYSMKLLGETHLGGQVDFVSVIGEGTTFKLYLPGQ